MRSIQRVFKFDFQLGFFSENIHSVTRKGEEQSCSVCSVGETGFGPRAFAIHGRTSPKHQMVRAGHRKQQWGSFRGWQHRAQRTNGASLVSKHRQRPAAAFSSQPRACRALTSQPSKVSTLQGAGKRPWPGFCRSLGRSKSHACQLNEGADAAFVCILCHKPA